MEGNWTVFALEVYPSTAEPRLLPGLSHAVASDFVVVGRLAGNLELLPNGMNQCTLPVVLLNILVKTPTLT